MRVAACAALALLAAAPRDAGGQVLRARPPNVAAALRDSAARVPLLKRPWVRPVGSLLVPGSGQLASGQSRGLVYLAAELWIVSRAIQTEHAGREQANQFRTLLFDVARKQFTPARVDGPWDYYEAAEKFVESGVYNANPGGTFTPEPDTTTFNGTLWLLARRTFFVNPDSTPAPLSAPYQAALRFYQAHAVPDQLRYSWRGARLEQDVYRAQIRSSDDALRARTNYLGALVLNHLVSAIDALISLRLGGRPGVVPRVSLEPGQSGADVLVFAWNRQF
jgi:hypothetical protein